MANRRLLLGALAFAMFAAGPTLVSAQSEDNLLRLAPESSNVIVRIQVQSLLDSAIGRKEGWAKKQEAKSHAGLSLPPDAKVMLQASKVDWTDNFKSLWDISIVSTNHEPSMALIARAEGGYTDTIAGVTAVYSPRNAYFVPIASKTIAMMIPANRQEVSHWVASNKTRKNAAVSQYLQDSLERAGKSQFTIACDTSNLLSVPQVKSRLRESASLKGKTIDLEALASVLSGLKGISLSVNATDTLQGKLQVDFSESAGPIQPFARDLILETLEEQGLNLPEFREWRTNVVGKSVHFEGKFSPNSLSFLLAFVAIPSGSLPTGKSVEGGGNSTGSQPLAVTSSRKYFDEVTRLVDDLREKSKSSRGYNMSIWVDRYALQIDRLPVLNVDNDLLEYGTFVSSALRSVRNVKIDTRANEQFNRATNFGNSGGFGFYNDIQAGATVLRRQADAMIAVNVNNIWTVLETKSADIRKRMSLKYKVEF